ncbi:7-carboxy-7-deazaguanine synthase QueE [Cytophagaceae bacterium ABcell3]|nr:7-carboxy-7-deazaguanine synthase QueE [Cytophagaceae bacterium ABcell3]
MEDFYTIQGEGFHQGKAAYFIRLAGCDVGCHWCDVKDSWDKDKYPAIDVNVLLERALKFPSRTVVVTGGEPLMYNLSALTKAFHLKGFKVHIETSGVCSVTGIWDWVCFSPKKFKEPNPEIYRLAHELKVVIFHKSDLEWAEQHAAQVSPRCRLFLQPEWGKQAEMLPLIVDYVKTHPRWHISLQAHKYMDIP